ncbi:peptide/nickel transport system substrate-binding protein [Cohaesibacter sp. ES.047]|uniref:extracellular solute-binding protein n=1 Tax=Cohaesibacter sp. ES.047 TaxID=1798205 RepID=UPI000BB83DA0|nr:extracellular solute-binding protein [Cohaesibacter sp. ES.047]SNY93328.1 peptide/nickel transport system substrate-binding protein [Cohaesibacter sp. ES.047]
MSHSLVSFPPSAGRLCSKVLSGKVIDQGLKVFSVLSLAVGLLAGASVASWGEPVHGIAMHGEPKYPADFVHLDYVNPDAPKGGKITYGGQGSFDSLNPFILKGVAPRGLWDDSYGLNVYEPLLMRTADEAFSLYGLIAESVELPEDRSSITFTLRDNAKFSDGHVIDVEDVKFTVDLLKEYGRPAYQSRLKRVVSIEEPGPRQIRFVFENGEDRELPLLIGTLPVLPAHVIDPEKISKSGMYEFIGSGPYVLDRIDAGTKIVLKRNPDYWAKDLPIKIGQDNFDEIHVEYFRDNTAMFEAFKKGVFDVLPESDPARWANQYDFTSAKDGRVKQRVFESRLPKGMSGFVFNTRKPVFENRAVRRTLAKLFDFNWVNKNLYYGLFTRSSSYFESSILSSVGVEANEAERALLAPYIDSIDADILDGTYRPVSAEDGREMRQLMRGAIADLAAEGYVLKNGVMTHAETGRPLAFEFLATSSEQERLALTYNRILQRIGVKMSIRTVDSAQYWERRKTMDFDMMKMSWSASLSPGTEQYSRWHSSQRDQDGWFNQAGADDPAVDAMIEALLAARSQDEFTAAVRAFDRTLINGYYVLPLFHKKDQWVGIWTRIGIPGKEVKGRPLSGYRPTVWWYRGE